MSPQFADDDARPPANDPEHVERPSETSDRFIERMMDEGASLDAARRASLARSEYEGKQQRPGELLPGWTARRWQTTTYVLLGCFLVVLISVLFTAPAFHPEESARYSSLWGTLFLVTFLPVVVLMVASLMAWSAKVRKEASSGYTTLRWLSRSSLEIRDSHGTPIPPGDKRLAASAKYTHAFIAIGSACAVAAPLLWILRLVVH